MNEVNLIELDLIARNVMEGALKLEQSKQIVDLLEKLCDNFEWVTFLDNDIARGSLLGKYSVYFKRGDDFWEYGENKKKGLIMLGSAVESELHLDIFKKNFVTTSATGDPEEGWCEETLLEMLKYIEREYTKSEYLTK